MTLVLRISVPTSLVALKRPPYLVLQYLFDYPWPVRNSVYLFFYLFLILWKNFMTCGLLPLVTMDLYVLLLHSLRMITGSNDETLKGSTLQHSWNRPKGSTLLPWLSYLLAPPDWSSSVVQVTILVFSLQCGRKYSVP